MEAFDSLEQPLCDYNESMDALPELWESDSFEPSIAIGLDDDDNFSQSNWPTGLKFSLMSSQEDSNDGLCTSEDGEMVVLHDRLITDASVSNSKALSHSRRIDKLQPTVSSLLLETYSEPSLSSYEKSSNIYSITIDCRGDIEISEDSKPCPKMENHSRNPHSLTIKKEPVSPGGRPDSPDDYMDLSSTTESRKRPISFVNNLCTRERQIVKVKSVSGNSRLILARVGASSSNKSASFSLPPTPPSSTSSDSEGSLSPLRDVVSPKLEIEEGEISKANDGGRVLTTKSLADSNGSQRHPINSPLISYQPKGSTGVLQLTEEEKRTLLAEGYPVPTRLPLTKAEEKSLKKIRRKIKNKISAQESRRKKKEYMDTLERRAQVLADENSDFRQRLHKLESDNAALQLQLTRLKQLFSKQISDSDQYSHLNEDMSMTFSWPKAQNPSCRGQQV